MAGMTDIISRLLDEAEKAQRKGHLVLAEVCRDASDRVGLLEHEVERRRSDYEKLGQSVVAWIDAFGALKEDYTKLEAALRECVDVWRPLLADADLTAHENPAFLALMRADMVLNGGNDE